MADYRRFARPPLGEGKSFNHGEHGGHNEDDERRKTIPRRPATTCPTAGLQGAWNGDPGGVPWEGASGRGLRGGFGDGYVIWNEL